MTVTDEGRTGYGCNQRAVCSGTQTAWSKGCRHPEAIEAHEQWLAQKRAAREAAAAWPEGQCLAATHGTRYAAEVNACRCPEALRKVRAASARVADRRRAERARDYSNEFAHEVSRVRRATGGRLSADPRRTWRFGKSGVSSITVMMMLHGFPDPAATRGERMVAIIRLEQQQIRAERTARMRPMLNSEIAARIGCTEATVPRLRKERMRRREQRHLRRLADVQWRAAHHAQGEARRPRP